MALTHSQRATLISYMADLGYADIETDGECNATFLAEYALIEYGDSMQLDDSETASIWELAQIAEDKAYKMADKHKLRYCR